MANDRYKITGTRQTQKFLPGMGFTRAVEIGFVSSNGYAGTVEIPELQAGNAAAVDAEICAYLDKIDAIHNL